MLQASQKTEHQGEKMATRTVHTLAAKAATTLVALLLSWPVQAQQPKVPIPDQIPGTTRVDADGVIKLVEKTPNLVIVDSRVSGDRKQGFIEGSISLPDEETSCASLAKAIPSKATPALFYCNGVKCGRSVVAIRIAKKCGYSQLYWFRGGFEEWLAKRFPVVNN
jgi:rhodanese-related sulfurtransferase